MYDELSFFAGLASRIAMASAHTIEELAYHARLAVCREDKKLFRDRFICSLDETLKVP
jgi:hypothetical protein